MSNDFSINDYKDNSAYQILRGIKKADVRYDWQKTDDTSIIDLAEEKANSTENKSAITVALEDFTKTTHGFNGSNSSNINSEDVQLSFFEKSALDAGQTCVKGAWLFSLFSRPAIFKTYPALPTTSFHLKPIPEPNTRHTE